MQTETKLTARLVKAWSLLPSTECISIMGNTFQAPGWCDVFITNPRWSGLIEFKNPDTVISPIQHRIINTLRRNGSPVFLVRFLEQTGTKSGTKEDGFWKIMIDEGRVYEFRGTDCQVAVQLLKVLEGIALESP